MERFLQVCAGILVTVLVTMLLNKQAKEMSLLLVVLVCCMTVAAAMWYLDPVIDFLGDLQAVGQLDPNAVGIILKTVGISLLAEIAALICADSGNSALGKSIQLLAVVTVLWLSLPLFGGLMDMVRSMLGEV